MMPRARHLLLYLGLIGLTLTFPFALKATELPNWLKLGFTERLRIETTDNATSLSDEAESGYSYLRVRTSLMAQIFPYSHFEVTTRLTNEFRQYLVQESREFDWDETIFDLLYLRWDSIGGAPVSLVFGRQNLTFGEGFVIFEGGPLDGSRTAYFNATQAIWQLSPTSALTLIYTQQPTSDGWLPIIRDQERKMVEQEERAFVAYYTQMIGSANVQAYFINKNNEELGTLPKATIYCPGIRLQTPLLSRLTATAEVAGQFGSWGEADQSAFGGYGYVTYETGWPVHFPKSFTLGTFYMSGDNLSTEDYEGWEPMFGRWPKWSESYVYTLSKERCVAYWSNLASFFARATVAVAPDVTLNLDYHHLMAPQYGQQIDQFASGTGRNRGDLFIGKLAYQMNPHLAGHLIVEQFDPATFYVVSADESTWVRMEMLLKF